VFVREGGEVARVLSQRLRFGEGPEVMVARVFMPRGEARDLPAEVGGWFND